MPKSEVIWNHGTTPIYISKDMRADPHGGPGTPDWQAIVMPGQGIDLEILNMSTDKPAKSREEPKDPE